MYYIYFKDFKETTINTPWLNKYLSRRRKGNKARKKKQGN